MDILIKSTRISSWKNKDKGVESFRKDEKKVKTSIPRMGWFRYSGWVEILYVCWPFITWWSKEGQVQWWIKIQNIYVIKENTKKQVLCGITNKQIKFIIHPEFMVSNQENTDQFIQNIKSNPNMVHDLTGEIKKWFLKKIRNKYPSTNTKNLTHHWQ